MEREENKGTTRRIVAKETYWGRIETQWGPAQDLPAHFHEEVQVVLTESRLVAYRLRGATWKSPRGTVFLIPSGEVHAATVHSNAGNQPLRTILLPLRAVAKGLGIPGPSNKRVPDPILPSADLLRTLGSIHRKMSEATEGLEVDEGMQEILSSLQDHILYGTPAEQPRCHARLKRARERLAENLDSDLRLSEIASEVGWNAFHFLREFRSAFGITPHAFRTQIRVSRARALLLQRSAPADVAAQLGFSDQSHLCRVFKRFVGVSPAKYQNSNFVQDGRL